MKWGLGDSYDNVSILSVKTRAYIDLTKPASSVGVAGGYLLGSLFFFTLTSTLETALQNASSILYVVVTMFLVHGASQELNMAEDAEMDRATEHKKDRPIPAGILEEEEARTLAWIAMFVGVGRAYLVDPDFGVMVSLLAFFGVFYNLAPIRAKERIISIPWQAASRGLLSFPTIWAAYGDPLNPLAWTLGMFMFFYVMGFQNSADIIDRKVDEEYGIKTFVVIFGVRGVAVIATVCMIAMVGVITGGVYIGTIPPRMLSMLLMMPLCMAMLYHMVVNSTNVSSKTGNHPAWLWFYGGMVVSVAIPLATEMLL